MDQQNNQVNNVPNANQQNNQVNGVQPSNNFSLNNQNNKPFKLKKKPNLLIILIILLVIGGIAYFIFTKVNIITTQPKDKEEEIEKIKVDTGESWGDKYALYVQDLLLTVDRFDITYIDFNDDNIPEAIVKYSTDTEDDLIYILTINNDEVSATKVFHNASFKLLYSTLTDEVNWYIYIKREDKYGAYTLMSKILAGTALDSDIKATNDKEIATFNANYVASPYEQKYYEVKESSFADDFKTSVSKYDDYLTDTNDAITKLFDDNKATTTTPELDDNDYITINNFVLHYGEYVTEVPKYENGEQIGVDEKVVVINRDGTITDGDEVIKFQVFTSSIVLENNISFKVIKDDIFVYGTGTGLTYKLKGSNEN